MEVVILMRHTVLFLLQKNRTKALYSPENEQAYFSGSCWAYGKHQWCYFLVKEKNLENGGDTERETLNIVNDRTGTP